MRKKKVIKRHPVQPDRKFASLVVSQLINKVMKNGEKRKATKIVYQATQIVEKSLPKLQEKTRKDEQATKKATEGKKEGGKLTHGRKKVETIATDQEQALLITASWSFLTVLEGALANTKPNLELKTRKLGGAKYRIPTKVSEQRALSLALR